jgi:hypothetical protein
VEVKDGRDLVRPLSDVGSSRHVMITEIGHFALVLALWISVLQASLPLYGPARGDGSLIAWAGPVALALLGEKVGLEGSR